MKQHYLMGLCLALASTMAAACGDDTSDDASSFEPDAQADESSSEGSTADEESDESTNDDESNGTEDESDTSATDDESSVDETDEPTASDSRLDAASGSPTLEPDASRGETSPGDSDAATEQAEAGAASDEPSDSGSALPESFDSGSDAGSPITYYQHVLPLFERNCVQCHQSSGIGPFALTDYDAASAWAEQIQAQTTARTMPPNLVLNDGSCGDFTSAWLSDAEIALIAAWAEGGALEGEARAPVIAELPTLTNSVDTVTPEFFPEEGGGALDLHDEYRCFLSDFETEEELQFVTGFNVIPGNDKLVHHVLGFIVDVTADSSVEGTTNGDLIAALDSDSPDREGWPCFGMAGEGVDVEAVPVSWAPGQGVITYPDESGLIVTPTRRLVVQVHYNLADPDTHGQSDETIIQLQVTPPDEVENVGVFLLRDPLLDSLQDDPILLEPGQESELYTWQETFAELGLPPELPAFNLYGVSPHMHELGHRYTIEIVPAADAGAPVCVARVNEWDFHWQHTYFYTQPVVLTPADAVRVTCDYDTSSKTEPVLPGWGTRNEMCLGNLYVTFPKTVFGL